MKRQLSNLVLVQELDVRLAEASAAGAREQEEAAGPSREAKHLRAERARIAASVSAELLQRYERLRQRYPRAVVATRQGVCFGCFTVRPTAMASRAEGLEYCERCGRILVQLEVREAEGGVEPATPQAVTRASRKKSTPRRSK